MAIYRLLQKSAFGPEDTKRMAEAYELALSQLGLSDRRDPFTEIVAKLIIEIVADGRGGPLADLRACGQSSEKLEVGRRSHGRVCP